MKVNKLFLLAALAFAALTLLTACGGSEEPKEEAAAAAVTVTINADAQLDGAYAVKYQEMEVASDLAESYGFTDQVKADKSVSALDVLVALHEKMYGEDFTLANCGDYLTVKDGWISMAFGKSTSSWSVMLNGESAHGDTESSYGGFEALNVDQTKIADGDTVDVVAYQDTENYADNALWVLQDGTKLTTIEAVANEDITLTVKGYTLSMYGSYGTDAISSQYLIPAEGVQLALLDKDGTMTDIDTAVTDSNGEVTFYFAGAGETTLVAYYPAASAQKGFIAAVPVTVK